MLFQVRFSITRVLRLGEVSMEPTRNKKYKAMYLLGLPGGGFKHFLFSSLQFDYCNIFQMGGNHQLARIPKIFEDILVK